MSLLARDFFDGNPMLAGPLLAMLIFTIVFAAAVVRATRAKKEHVTRMASLPFEGEDDSEVADG